MSPCTKPTPGPWRIDYRKDGNGLHLHPIILAGGKIKTIVADVQYAADAALIAEAGTVLHATGRTPMQLAEDRAGLLAALVSLRAEIRRNRKLNIRTDYSLMVADMVAGAQIEKSKGGA